MDLHFLKIKSECLGLTSKNFRYRTPTYFSNLICSYSGDTTCGVPHPTDAGQPFRAQPPDLPPLNRIFSWLEKDALSSLVELHSSLRSALASQAHPSQMVSPDGVSPLGLHTLWCPISHWLRSLPCLLSFQDQILRRVERTHGLAKNMWRKAITSKARYSLLPADRRMFLGVM